MNAYSERTMDKMMARVYGLVPVVGHKRAITEVAGSVFVGHPDMPFVPNLPLQEALLERFNAEMAEYVDNARD